MTPRDPGRGPAIALATLLAVLAGGCATDPTKGYVAGSTYRPDVSTIAVPIFENDSFYRDIGFELTEALIKEIEARTPYKAAPSSRADTILTGRITGVELDELSKSRLTGLGEEVIVSVTIDFQWRDLRNDELLVERLSFAGYGLFSPSTPTGERIELGQTVVVQQLARDIVAQMNAPW